MRLKMIALIAFLAASASIVLAEPYPDITTTAEEIAAAEKQNGARFEHDYIGKIVQLSGKVNKIESGYFTFKTPGSLMGWPVYTDDKDLLMRLNSGDEATITCAVKKYPLIGGVSECSKK